MMVSTNEALLDQLKTSQIFSAEELQRAAGLISDQDDSKSAARKLVGAGLLTRWQAGQLLKGSKATLVLGKYVLLDRLPWGGAHAVFLAKHPTMDRKVALNVLDKTSSARSDAVKSFLADARAIASLDHRHLIHVYDIDEADNRYFLVMEHVEGRNLHDAVKASGKMSIETAANIMRQIADGLDHAHRSKLVHGGLRPTNVLLDGQGVVKIIDLGVSKFDDPTKPPEGAANDSQVLEVANFLSPEQAAGGAATAQSDLYSLGCIGYMLLAGEPPFGTGDYAQRLVNHQNASPPDIASRRKEVPEGLVAILKKLMAKSLAERYGSAKEVVTTIEGWWSAHAAQLEAAKPKPKPTAKPPAAKPATASKPAPAPATKGAPTPAAKPGSKQAPAKGAAKPVAEPDEAETVADLGFPAIQLGPPRKSSAGPAKKLAAKPAAPPASEEDAEAMDVADEAPALVAPKGKKSPPALPKKAAVAAVSSEGSEKGKSHLPLILAAVGGGLLVFLLLGGGGTAAYFLFMRGDDAVAVNEHPDDKVNAEGEAGDEESSGSEEESGDDETDEGEETAEEENGGDEPTTEAPATDDPPTTPTDPPTDPVPPVEPPATDPPATDPPATEPPKTDPPATDPPATDPPATNPPAEQPKPADPFTALATAVTLPPLKADQTAPIAIGQLSVPAETTCYIDLLGGEKALPKQGPKFTMELLGSGEDSRAWEIKLVGSARGDINLAKLALTDKELTFQWTPEGVAAPEAGYLANCIFSLRTADHGKDMQLREPQAATSLPVFLSQASQRMKFDIDHVTAPESLMIEILKADGTDKAHIEPKSILSAKQDSTMVWFGEGEEKILGIKIDTMMQKDLQVMVTPIVNDPTSGPTKFTAKKVASAKAQLAGGIAQLGQRLQAWKNSPQKEQLKEEIASGELQLESAQKSLGLFDKLEAQYQAVNERVSVQFRVYHTDGEHQIDLVRSSPAEVKAPPQADVPQLDLDKDGK